jgi:hypothetical protein
MADLSTIPKALQALQDLSSQPLHSTGAWDLPHVLHHYAQSVEYSLGGFPQMKPRWFRASVGPAALGVFKLRGRMSHGLDAAIPGAPDIAQGLPLAPAIARATTALRAFEAHRGPLQPHFAYGALDKPAYTRAHLMHLADHWRAFAPGPG